MTAPLAADASAGAPLGLLEHHSPGVTSSTGTAAQDEDLVDRERALRCRRCQRDITTARAAIEVNGAHAHTFFNPAGILFEIGCFAAAPGCALVGPPSTEFAWFAGHSWRIAVCGGCGQHLGWMFTGADVFFGLFPVSSAVFQGCRMRAT